MTSVTVKIGINMMNVFKRDKMAKSKYFDEEDANSKNRILEHHLWCGVVERIFLDLKLTKMVGSSAGIQSLRNPVQLTGQENAVKDFEDPETRAEIKDIIFNRCNLSIGHAEIVYKKLIKEVERVKREINWV